MNETKDGYKWVGYLANEKPQAMNANPITGLASQYKFEVKIGSELKYNTLSTVFAKYAGREVAIEDYLTPWKLLKDAQDNYDHTLVLALQEEIKTLPWSLVWEEYCKQEDCLTEDEWFKEVREYEENVLLKRGK